MVAEVKLKNDAEVADLKTLLQLLESVFALDARFHDGELTVSRNGPPGGQLEQEMEPRHTTPGGDVREKVLDAKGDDEPAMTDQEASEQDDQEGGGSSDEPGPDASGSDGESEPSCQYCGDSFDPRGINRHEQNCGENPANDAEEAAEDEATCEHCGDTFAAKGLGPHQRHCPDNPANAPEEDEDDGQEPQSSTNEPDSDTDTGGTGGGSLPSDKPEAIQEAMENPDDLPDDPVPVGVAMQYNAGSYTCDSCDTCLGSDQDLTEHVNETGHRGAYLVNRRGC